MDDLNDLFASKSTKARMDTAPVEDATATQETDQIEVLDLPTETNEPEVNLDVESLDSEPQEELNQTPEDQNSSNDDWKTKEAKYESEIAALKKQHSDYQSYKDKQYNDLDKKLNTLIQQPQTQSQQVAEQPKQLTAEEFNDKFYDNPFEAVQAYAAQYGNQSQTQNPSVTPQEIQMQVQEGVERSMHTDYDEVIEQVKKQVAYKPEILQKIQESPNPSRTAYEVGLELRQAEMIQKDPLAFEKELREKWESEQNSNNNSSSTLRNIPSSSPSRASASKSRKNSNDLDSIFAAGKRKMGGYA